MKEIKYRQADKEDLYYFQGNLFTVLTFLALFSALSSIKASMIKFPQALRSEAVQNIHEFGHKVHFTPLVKTTMKSGEYLESRKTDLRMERDTLKSFNI